MSIFVVDGGQQFKGHSAIRSEASPSDQFSVIAKPEVMNCNGEALPVAHVHPAFAAGAVLSSRRTEDHLALHNGERWFLVHTFPKRETQAQIRLEAQGFRSFLPQYLKTTRHARQLRTVRAPLFPRYLFVVLNLERDRWLSIRSTIGVTNLVGLVDRPTPVPRGIVEAFVAQTDEANLVRLDSKLSAGDPVRIVSGPFADLIGSFDRTDDAGRVRLLLKMMGSTIVVTMPRTGVLPAA